MSGSVDPAYVIFHNYVIFHKNLLIIYSSGVRYFHNYYDSLLLLLRFYCSVDPAYVLILYLIIYFSVDTVYVIIIFINCVRVSIKGLGL